MLEIELKAHVYDRNALVKKLEGFAEYEKTVKREDSYFRLYKNPEKPE